jgi:predicted transcriptional regulator
MSKPGSTTPPRVLERLLGRLRGQPRPDGVGILDSCYGPLEVKVLEALWSKSDAVSVRALGGEFPDIAYTTLMTTLDRLFKKDALARERVGRAYLYRPRCPRSELEALLARDAFGLLLGGRRRGARARPVLSGLVDAVGADDALLLDELERLVREKQAKKKDRARPGKRNAR